MIVYKYIASLLCLLISSGTFAQSVNNITIKNGKMAYLQSDSLFIENMTIPQKRLYIDKGLNDNGNQRFLNWTPDGKFLIFEKNSELFVFSVQTRVLKKIKHRLQDSLILFTNYQIEQAAINDRQQLYFSAEQKDGGAKTLQLFRIDILAQTIAALTSDTASVGNVGISHNGHFLAYSSYRYLNKSARSVLHVTNQNGSAIIPPISFEDTFFRKLVWSRNGRFLLAVAEGNKAMLFRMDALNKTLTRVTIKLDDGETATGFYDDSSIVFTKIVKGVKQTGILKLSSNRKTIVLSQNETYLGNQVDKFKEDMLYFRESRTQPKAIWRKELRSKKSTLVKSFAQSNPLGSYNYVTKLYKDGDGGMSSAYIYMPSNYNEDRTLHPVIVIPYGNYRDEYPKLEYFLYEHLFEYLAKGYIIIFPNTRGISSQVQKDEYGKVQLKDTELLIDQAENEFRIDKSRLWVMGHSHGATMAYYYLTHSNTFAGGIAINGAADWIKQAELKRMSGLPAGMGGDPAQLHDKYLDYSPIENIKNLTKPFLIVAGKTDTQIPYDINAKAFYEAAAKKNTLCKILLFENEGHLIEDVKNRQLLWQAINKLLSEN